MCTEVRVIHSLEGPLTGVPNVAISHVEFKKWLSTVTMLLISMSMSHVEFKKWLSTVTILLISMSVLKVT